MLIDSKQETGKVSIDFHYNTVDAAFASQMVAGGIRVGDPQRVALDATVGLGLGVKGRWLLHGTAGPVKPDEGLRLTAAGAGEVRLHLRDAWQFYARHEKEYGTDGSRRTVDQIGANKPLFFTAQTFTSLEDGVLPNPVPNPENGTPTPESESGTPRDPAAPKPKTGDKPVRLYYGAEARREVEKLPLRGGGTTGISINVFELTVGGRF
jgi:hypothetical protein